MADNKINKKGAQLSLDEYNKVKEKRAHSKLQLHFPWPIKVFLALPIVYVLFMIFLYLRHIRFVAEH